MGFQVDLDRFVTKIRARHAAVFQRSVLLTYESIKLGSPITGAPGQPVDTGALRNSWQVEFITPFEAKISSVLLYAQSIEDGIGQHGPLTLRSVVGGFHSVKLTIAGFDQIVAHALGDTTQENR
jgi:hypothetical protein